MKKAQVKTHKAETGERRCIVSGVCRPKAELIRFVVGPNGQVVPDLAEKLPGRGLWLSAERGMIHTACAKNAFAKAARAKVKAADGLADQVEALLTRRCLDLIGLARRAGNVTNGFEKVRTFLRSHRAAILFAASDGGDDGRAKVRALAKDVPLLDLFSAAELGATLGRDNAVHLVIAPGGLADKILVDAGRLAGFRASDDPMSE